MTPAEQHKARLLIEAAAELDPETYVPVLDALDEIEFDCEPEPLEMTGDDYFGSSGVRVVEHCPCCGSVTGTEYWTT